MIETGASGVELSIVKVADSFSLQDGDSLIIINNDGTDPINGTFKNLPEGAILSSNFLGTGLTAKISYKGLTGNDNDVVLTLSPGFPWHNDANPFDTVGSGTITPDGQVVPGDALAVINYINAFGPGPVPDGAALGLPFGFLDTTGGPNGTGDNNIAPADALEIINAINAGQGGEGEANREGEAPAEPLAATAGLSSSASRPAGDELLTLLALDIANHSSRRKK